MAAQCPTLSPLPDGHHGFVILTDASGNKDKLFYAFSRVENPASNGFTVEGYPIGHIGGGDPDSQVAGVKRRTSTNPVIQTNCFVAARDGDIDYSISLDVAGSQTLPAVAETLHAGEMRRYLDIFAQAGAPLPDYDNVTVTFSKNDPTQWKNTLIAFCTVQDNTSFGADFRIAKTFEAADPSQSRLNCFAASFGANDTCTDTLQPSGPSVPDAATKVRLLTRVYAPDTVRCSIVGPPGQRPEDQAGSRFPSGHRCGRWYDQYLHLHDRATFRHRERVSPDLLYRSRFQGRCQRRIPDSVRRPVQIR